MEQYKFIKTKDINTYDKLIDKGFKEIKTNEQEIFVFLNCSKVPDTINLSKVFYSNKICI